MGVALLKVKCLVLSACFAAAYNVALHGRKKKKREKNIIYRNYSPPQKVKTNVGIEKAILIYFCDLIFLL